MTMMHQRAFHKLDCRIRLAWAAASADTFLASYPKSGRTWLRSILSHYFAHATGDHETIGLHDMFQVVPNYDLDPVRGIPAFRYRAWPADMPLVLVTHHLYRRSIFLNRPIVFMVRDPRDVIVSAYFHATRHKNRFAGDFDAFIDNEEQGTQALVRYLNGWGRGLARHRSVVLSYEELSADTLAASTAIVEFLGRTPEPALMAEAVRASRFEAMREREIEHGLPSHDYDRGDAESLRMRRGKVGGFGDYLTETQVARIVGLCSIGLTPAAKALIARTGLDLR